MLTCSHYNIINPPFLQTNVVLLSPVCDYLFSDLACSVAGITSDANVLTNELRLIAQR